MCTSLARFTYGHEISHNRKKFVLFDVQSWRHLYLYPRFSFKHRQLGVDLNNLEESLSNYPHFANATAFEVILEEGDMLYLPPLYFHQVGA